jgi:hypothetical protein
VIVAVHERLLETKVATANSLFSASAWSFHPKLELSGIMRKQEDAKKHCEEKIREYIEARAAEIERHR